MKQASLFFAFIGTFIVSNAQNVGIGTSSPDVKLHIVAGTVITPASGGFLQLGLSTNLNLALDNNGIQARNNGVVSKLGIQAFGGNLGIGTAAPDVKVHIAGGTDVSAASGGFLQIGGSTIPNLAFDNNEIQARDNGVASTLYLQHNGGDVGIGNINPLTKLDVNGQITLRGGNPGADKVLTSDASGTASWTNAARGTGFFVNSVPSQSIASGVATVINFQAVDYDDGGNFNTTNDFFNCPTTGFYHFDVTVNFTTPNTFIGSAILIAGLYKNGSAFWSPGDDIVYTPNTTSHSFGLNTNLTAGDNISVRVYQNTGKVQEVYQAAFSGYRVY